MALFNNGITLKQHKEPALSKPIVRFVNPQTENLGIDYSATEIIENLTIEDLIEIAKSAQIVDERDGKLLYRKLLRAQNRAVAVIADAVDDEPYVSSKIAPLIRNTDEVIGGLLFCKKIANTDKLFIMIYKMRTRLETRLPKNLQGAKIIKIGGAYPAPAHLTKIDVGAGRKLTVGTGALIQFYRAVLYRKRQSTIFVTVAGNCVANPMNLEVSIGMSINNVLERCGVSSIPTRVVCGGPMTGIAIMDTENTLVTYTTRAVLAFSENDRDTRYTCIGCGRCEQVCPSGLNPMYIHRFVQNSYMANLKPFDAHMCIGCGTCSYICPSKLPVSESAKRAKQYAIKNFIGISEEADEFEA